MAGGGQSRWSSGEFGSESCLSSRNGGALRDRGAPQPAGAALRIAVPTAVALAMAAIVGVSVFNPFRMLMPKLPVDVGNLVVSGTKITMESPHMAGYTPDQRPYEVWAKTAVQDITDPDHVDLKTLRAKLRMEDQSTVTLDALDGRMDTKDQLLDLHHDIHLANLDRL